MTGYQTYQAVDKQRRDAVVREHLELVYRVARRVANATALDGLEVQDLVQAGVLGLYRALDKYDEARGVPFAAYAMHFVRGAMLDEVRKSSHVPRGLRQKERQVKAAWEALTQQRMREPTDAEVAEYLGIPEVEYEQWLQDLGWTTLWSVEELEAAGSLHVVDEHEASSPTAVMDRKVSKALLVQALKRLSPKEQQVLYAYYEEELTLKEIAYVMNLSESQISRIHSKAILRLRGMLNRKKADLVL
ncbi:RNA polymerase sigma factor FliA [Alicyclobacillus contaminans]|uniref:sigma-70 family RNA polymerase sigma factor n=1 Tax=Alicyclobacillus contaminans TaxID=392016 RepID=UPI00041B4C0D|nr:FliA/WhiG family RNA polymerase sigma factor [Alicyclobacillus contaminans]GMA51298.1 RNA polymerase sigma factor FliA [Alicyclobacillus contaminans]